MPELPEVETVRKGLSQLVIGKKISKVEVFWPKIIERLSPSEFNQRVSGQTIHEIKRRGKFLIFCLDQDVIISHLRMEGKYHYFPEITRPNKHVHVVFTFSDGSQLHYQDVRKFGRMCAYHKNHVEEYPGIAKLGPEPFKETFDLKIFQQQLKKSSKAIKPLLLDQKLVTGLGNIYVDESLWQAKIHPETPANELKPKEIQELHHAIIEVLAKAIQAGGTTIRSYVNALGDAGNFQVELNAYGQEGMPCPRCGTPIQKIKVVQRGTHFCPKCQKKRGK